MVTYHNPNEEFDPTYISEMTVRNKWPDCVYKNKGYGDVHPTLFKYVICRCCCYVPTQRPDIMEVLKMLKQPEVQRTRFITCLPDVRVNAFRPLIGCTHTLPRSYHSKDGSTDAALSQVQDIDIEMLKNIRDTVKVKNTHAYIWLFFTNYIIGKTSFQVLNFSDNTVVSRVRMCSL